MLNKYEKMSDLELNTRICTHLPVIVEANQSAHIPSGDSCAMVNDIVDMYRLNFCSNPSDIMPLVFELKISLSPIQPYMGGMDDSLWCASAEIAGFNVEIWHSNPLRAAAIVYLMIMEGEHGK